MSVAESEEDDFVESEEDYLEEPECCPMCNGLGEDPRTEKICTSCHGQGWKTEEDPDNE